ncbi:MAG: hypothetical protein JSW51_15125 [Gemmatimonadota bacterium]|nr:MAG: hypothetical protein JSW51_15125 [Gemmatimonadota bacterium]
MLLASALAFLTMQLGTVQITIDLDGSKALVNARYELDGSAEALAFNIIRLPGQEVRFNNIDRSDAVRVDTLNGLYRLTFDSSSSPVILEYEVSGTLSRIPLPVPNAVTQPGDRSVSIRIRGLGVEASLEDGFPRFEMRSVDTAVAELDNVPGFVRLPPDAGQWSVNRISELAVILLIVLVSGAWLLRRRGRDPSHRYSADRL